MNRWLFKLTIPNVLIILLGTVINLFGRWMAAKLVLPIWLDSVGTFLSAVMLGPVAGALSGVLMNIVTEFFRPGQLIFMLVSIAGGIAVGRFFPRDRKIESFSVVATALFAGIIMTIVSTPLNLLFNNGYTGNAWGDALVDMVGNYMNVKPLCCFLGGLLVNMPDKALSIGIALLILHFIRRNKNEDNGNGKEDTGGNKPDKTKNSGPVTAVLIAAPFLAALLSYGTAEAAEDAQSQMPDFTADFAETIYGINDGLVSMEINTIEQTLDGYIWAGAYSGLYRYNGSRFEKIDIDERISNVLYLYEDDDERLWIGTNDSGVACYDMKADSVVFYTGKEGMPSDSIRSICGNGDGDVLVSTTKETVRIDHSGEIFVYDSEPDITCLYSLERLDDGNVAGVTSNGIPVIYSGDNIRVFDKHDGKSSYTALACDNSGNIIMGTSGNEVCLYHRDHNGHIKWVRSAVIEGLNEVNAVRYSESLDGFFICASTGLMFIDKDLNSTDLSRDDFGNSVTDAIVDYQDNIWFVSNTQGIMKLSYDPFSKLSVKAGISPAPVNALLLDKKTLYIGTDSGLKIIDVSTNQMVKKRGLTETFEGVRIRHIMKDSESNLWISTYGANGLYCLGPDLHVEKIYNSSDDPDVLGNRFRFTMELSDGTILASSTEGLNYIKDGKVVRTLGVSDGLRVPQILSATELPEGYILAGSDGDGIYVIEDMKVTDHIGADEGLMSQVVLRIVQCGEGRIYVTSNGLYYGSPDRTIRKLSQFPYNNNYDVYVNDLGEAWISSSAGIYVVNVDELTADEGYDHVLLNHTRGLDTTLTANAWNYSENGMLYLCCTDGVRCVDTLTFDKLNDNYNIVISGITVDEKPVIYENGIYMLPSGRGRLRIQPAVLSYTLANPLVSIELIGVDETPVKMYQKSMSDITYSGITYGDHMLSVKVIDELTGRVKKEQVFNFHKEAELYERLYYKLYLLFVGTMLIAFLAWMIAKMSNMAVINRQYDQIREAKEEAEYANQAKSRFLANMSHEIRTPINAVLGMDEMILRESSEPEIRGYATDIYTAGNTLLSLINDILDSSKIESGKMEIVPVDYELATLIRDLVNMISQRAHAKDLKLVTEVDENLPTVLHGDDVRIRQAVTNILTNAVKYTPEGTVTMRVTGQRAEGGIRIKFEVEDTGIGIKEEDLPKLFEEFKRIDEKKNRHIEGTGLGMNITIQLLKLMDSKLEVKSVYGEGSVFWFELFQQIVDDTPMGDFAEKMTAPDERYNHKGAFIAPDAHVLVVDDNDMNRKVFKSLLKVTRMQISEAAGGAEALKLAEAETFDMVFMDHMMPDMDGVETMQHMRKIGNYDSVPIYVLTANAVTGAREQYLEAGFDGFIAKPVVSERLEHALREALPQEKVLPIEESGDADVNLNVNDTTGLHNIDSPEDLPTVDGLDWNFAYLHLPDMELLASSVNDFYDAIPVAADKLDRMYEAVNEEAGTPVSVSQDSSDTPVSDTASEEALTAYRIQVHAMKSSAATVGIVPLAGMAKVLEDAARDKNVNTILGLHNTFSASWRAYADKLKGVFGAGENSVSDEDKESADPEMTQAMLDMLSSALEDFDVDACDDIMNKIRSYSYDDETEALIGELAAYVTDLDTDSAQEVIERVRDSIG